MANDLEFGDKICNVSNISALNEYLSKHNINESGAEFCSWSDGSRCNSLNSSDLCKWHYTGTGLEYQLLVGPLFMVVLSFTGVPVSLVSEAGSLNRKNILSSCVLFWSVATVLTGWAQEYWQVAIARMSLALFEAPYLTFASSLLTCYFTKKHRSIVLASLTAAIFIGYASAFLLTILDDALGWRWTFWISGSPGLAISILMFTTVKERKPEQPIGNIQEKVNFKQTLREFKSPVHILLVFAMVLRNASGFVFTYNINNYFNHYYPDYPTEVFMAWGPVVSGCLGTFLGGILADRLARRWGTIGRFIVIILSSFLAAPLFVGALTTPPPGAFYWLLIAGCVSELWIGVGLSVVIDIAPVQIQTSCLAIYFFSYNMIGGNFNLMVTPMKNSFGWRWTMVGLVAGSLIIAVILFIIVACLLKLKSSRNMSDEDKSS
ncbi:D-galactonate transporter-like isoform X3 [Anneissia japonica]|nr:D-galactonate transporter-like isoform X3 [Anneissia japonica]XP_033098986.1 D-galactonate transporter-like isoform X3 [Anneissia japonica]